jgi:hypothetical protein
MDEVMHVSAGHRVLGDGIAPVHREEIALRLGGAARRCLRLQRSEAPQLGRSPGVAGLPVPDSDSDMPGPMGDQMPDRAARAEDLIVWMRRHNDDSTGWRQHRIAPSHGRHAR